MKKLTSEDRDLWTYLRDSGKKIVMYGMGNGADKILKVCAEKGIEISDFFASDGFVRGHQFHGKTVLSYADIKKKYSSFIVLLSFATSIPEVLRHIDEIASETELYVPSVPVFGETLFDMDFYLSHEDDFRRVYEMFSDERSREVYSAVINANLTGKLSFLKASTSERNEVWRSVLSPSHYRSAADLGAYNGDTVRELADYSSSLETVYALEPDRRTFKKLSAYAESENRFEVKCFECAAWNRRETLYFDGSGNRNANLCRADAEKKVTKVTAMPLDEIIGENHVDYIKYDVEGSEYEALEGSRETIRRCSPELLISMYHRSEDMFVLPQKAAELCRGAKLYLRRFEYLPAWDLNLYVIPQ